MATLTAAELTELRNGCEHSAGGTVTWTKAQVNAALQAIEDWFEDPATKAEVVSRINTATSPFTFPNPVKKVLVAHYLRTKFRREGV